MVSGLTKTLGRYDLTSRLAPFVSISVCDSYNPNLWPCCRWLCAFRDICCCTYRLLCHILLFVLMATSCLSWAVYASQAHTASVWRVTWAHPEFGSILATCSFDRTAAIWEELGLYTEYLHLPWCDTFIWSSFYLHIWVSPHYFFCSQHLRKWWFTQADEILGL